VTHPVMDWLSAGLPLSLLMDLASAGAPASDEIMRTEIEDLDWLPAELVADRVLDGLSAH
jgi:hypothetical protein